MLDQFGSGGETLGALGKQSFVHSSDPVDPWFRSDGTGGLGFALDNPLLARPDFLLGYRLHGHTDLLLGLGIEGRPQPIRGGDSIHFLPPNGDDYNRESWTSQG